jgi:phage replication-related protein YjqB (UPF0714/DUF867 family)
MTLVRRGDASAFDRALAEPGVVERLELRSPFGFMAFHGGALERQTDRIGAAAAEAGGASLYTVAHPGPDPPHFPSTDVQPQASPSLQDFLDHVEVVVTVHGYGRDGMFTSLLLGGSNRSLAAVLGVELRGALPDYQILDDLDAIPRELRGLHETNPVNLPRRQGVQIELPPRVRGSSMLWADWEGPGLTPHTTALVDGLVAAATTY